MDKKTVRAQALELGIPRELVEQILKTLGPILLAWLLDKIAPKPSPQPVFASTHPAHEACELACEGLVEIESHALKLLGVIHCKRHQLAACLKCEDKCEDKCDTQPETPAV